MRRGVLCPDLDHQTGRHLHVPQTLPADPVWQGTLDPALPGLPVNADNCLQEQQHCFQDAEVTVVQAPEASCSLPALSLDGDVSLVLDSGVTFLAHSLYLRHASTVFEHALACAPPAEASAGTEVGDEVSLPEPAAKPGKGLVRLPIPVTSKRQAQLLLHCLYCWERGPWAESLHAAGLVELARVAHRYGCASVLDLADRCLVKNCGVQEASMAKTVPRPWLTVWEAPAQYQLAERLHITSYGALVGRFLRKHAHVVDVSRLDPLVAAILQGACLIGR